jgi:hypothetical protein
VDWTDSTSADVGNLGEVRALPDLLKLSFPEGEIINLKNVLKVCYYFCAQILFKRYDFILRLRK